MNWDQFIGKQKEVLSDIDLYLQSWKEEKIPLEKQNERLLQIYHHNQALYEKEQTIKQEIEKLKKLKESLVEEPEQFVVPELPIKKEKKEEKIKHIDISFYISQIEESSNLNELEESLPRFYTEQFDDIINSLLLYFQKEKIEISNMILEEEMDPQEKKDFEKEKERIQQIFNIICQYRLRKNTTVADSIIIPQQNNHIIYLTKKNGDNSFLSKLQKDIDPEFYQEFFELLASIKDGSLKNVKTFHSKNRPAYYRIAEVKLNQTRILFKKINKDTFVIIDGFVKKCDTSTKYHDNLENKLTDFIEQKQTILKLIQNDEYLAHQQQETEKILEYLQERKRKGRR